METLNRYPIKSEKWTLITVAAFLLGIVAIPIGKAYWPNERARWLIAAAENALANATEENDTRNQAQELLERAASSYPEIEKTLDFARISFRMHPEETERAIKLVLSMSPDRQVHAANALAEMRLDAGDFESAYKILVAGYPGPTSRTPVERNQLAYYAALANRDLAVALADIESALSDSKNASFLDTKAWVLFRLGRLNEALESIDLAITALKGELTDTPFPSAVREKVDDLLEGREPFVKRPLGDNSDPLASFNESFANVLKSIVVIHYHRGEILEALGKIEEADQEYAWAQDRGFHDFNRLY